MICLLIGIGLGSAAHAFFPPVIAFMFGIVTSLAAMCLLLRRKSQNAVDSR